jgi:hypothetical protein
MELVDVDTVRIGAAALTVMVMAELVIQLEGLMAVKL